MALLSCFCDSRLKKKERGLKPFVIVSILTREVAVFPREIEKVSETSVQMVVLRRQGRFTRRPRRSTGRDASWYQGTAPVYATPSPALLCLRLPLLLFSFWSGVYVSGVGFLSVLIRGVGLLVWGDGIGVGFGCFGF